MRSTLQLFRLDFPHFHCLGRPVCGTLSRTAVLRSAQKKKLSKGFLSPQELDLHVADPKKTESRRDCLGSGAADPDQQTELVSQIVTKCHQS